MNSITRAHWLALLVVWAISIGYMATHLKRGWVPSDEGYFGQTAERVLHGELPHKDFDEGYTGGITFLNALAFRELGINSVSLRIVLFLFFIAWVPAILYVAGHFLSRTPFLPGLIFCLGRSARRGCHRFEMRFL